MEDGNTQLQRITNMKSYVGQRWNRVSGSRVTESPGQQFGSGSGRVTGQSSDRDFDPGSYSMQWKIALLHDLRKYSVMRGPFETSTSAAQAQDCDCDNVFDPLLW